MNTQIITDTPRHPITIAFISDEAPLIPIPLRLNPGEHGRDNALASGQPRRTRAFLGEPAPLGRECCVRSSVRVPRDSVRKKSKTIAVRFLTLLAVIGMTLASAQAQTIVPTNSVQKLTLRDATQAALLNNRMLQIERINPEVARMDLKAAYGYYDPLLVMQGRRENVSDSGAFDPANPAVDSGFESESDVANLGLTGFLPSGLLYNLGGTYGHSRGSRNFLNFDSFRVNASIYLQQPLLKNSWIDLPRLTIRVNKRNLQISEHGVHFVAMTVLNLVHQGYYDLAAASENLQVQQDLLVTRQQFLQGIQKQIEFGKMTLLEQRVAESQLAKVRTDLIASSNAVALAANQLRNVMGVTATNWTEDWVAPGDHLMVVSQTFDRTESSQRGLSLRPDLSQMTKTLENAELTRRFHRNQLFPSLDVIGSYGRRGASSVQAFPPDEPAASRGDAFDQIVQGDAPSDMIGLIFSVPLTRTAERANYRASKELKKQAELLVKQKEELILREVSDAIHNARYSLDRYHAARESTDSARQALKAEEEKLAGGKSSIIFVLQFQQDLAAAQSVEITAKHDYLKAVAQLYFAEGSILERNNIHVEFK